MTWEVRLNRDGKTYMVYDDENWYVMSSQDERRARLIAEAPQMLEALEAIRDQAECILQPLAEPSVSRARWEKVRDRAVAAIAAVKGEGDDR